MEEFDYPYYYIKDVADRTGISEQLIRKWESRYQMIQPKRLDNGYRVYTLEDILMLKEVKLLRDKGYSIKSAIHEASLRMNIERNASRSVQIKASPYVQQMIDKGKSYDDDGILLLLKQSNHEYGLDLFLQNTVHPFLKRIGDLWESGKWDESQETVSSLAVRDYLTEVSRSFTHDSSSPHVLGFCLPAEQHDIPLQILLLQIKMKGWRTTRVAASPKFTTIETLVREIKPKIVIFSASTLLPFQKNENLLEQLDEIAESYPAISFHIGGVGGWSYTEIMKPKYINISYTIDELLT